MGLNRFGVLLGSLLAAGVLAAAGCGGQTAAPPAAAGQEATAGAVTLLEPRDAQALIGEEDVEVLDVRTPEEYTEGHVAGATLIDFYEPDFADQIDLLDRGRTYVVYCRSGNRSGQAVALMAERGFTAVNDVDGGIVAWEAAGLPVSR